MKLFDYNIHLPCGSNNLDSRLQDETSMSGESFEACFYGYKNELEENCIGGNIMILNTSLKLVEIQSIVSTTKSIWSTSSVSVMVDPRDTDWNKRIEDLYEAGVTAIKFHCYIQKISEKDIPTCVEIASKAQSLGMQIMIDTSYGSLGMYKYDNLRLATAIADQARKAYIILLHSGGARCLDAMLLADAAENIFLETSFTLPYYLDSSIERDLAFVYRKIGEDRILYGSDFPYISLEESKTTFMKFMDKWGFTSSQIEKIAIHNALKINDLHG